jgi:hypothetical protein
MFYETTLGRRVAYFNALPKDSLDFENVTE